MKRLKKSSVKTITTMVILGCLIVGAFVYISNREEKEKMEQVVTVSTATKLIEKDLQKEYPPTPREVIKFYSNILQCVYSDELTEEQLTRLGEQVILLYDDELLSVNPSDEIIDNLMAETALYRATNQIISSYTIDSGDNIVTWKQEDVEYARLLAVYTIREESNFTKTCEEFILRKNEEGQWKIVGWRLADNNDL